MFKILYITFIYYLLSINNAFAYIDPGAGSIIVSAIIASFMYISVYIKNIYSLLKKYFTKIKKTIKQFSD